MKEIKVIRTDVYTSKKTGNQSVKITGLCEDGVIIFYAPLDDQAKPGDVYVPEIAYSSYKMAHIVRYVKK